MLNYRMWNGVVGCKFLVFLNYFLELLILVQFFVLCMLNSFYFY